MKTFISVGKFLHNCAALVSLFKPPVMLKKSNKGKLAPMRGKLTIKRDKKQRKKNKEGKTARRVGTDCYGSVTICM